MRSRALLNSYALFLALVAAPFLFPACSPPSHAPASIPPSAGPSSKVRVSSLEQRIHRLINGERKKAGLSLLAWDDALARIARGHSSDMGRRGFFSHYSPEGRDFSYRYRSQGYRCAIRSGTIIHLGAENIFQNNLYDSVTTVNGRAYFDWNSEEKIAETTVRGWMNSPGHRKNILAPHWIREGIGVYLAPDDKIYITQNFC